jgi:hypothetical protein
MENFLTFLIICFFIYIFIECVKFDIKKAKLKKQKEDQNIIIWKKLK